MGKPKHSQSRRRFLKQVAASAAAAGAAGALGLRPERLMAAAADRRHLINISCWGGVDPFWFHSAFPSSRLESYRSTHGAQIHIGFDARGFSPLSSEQVKDYKLTIRHDENRIIEHPGSPGNYLGHGISSVFSPADLQDILIWKGIGQEGQHGVGNNMINQGVSSQYAISFSAFVAEKLDQDFVRPLPYVAVAGNPSQLFLNTAMNRGAQVPICIPDWDAFKALTRPNPNDISEIDRRDLVNEAVRKLSNEILLAGTTLRASQRAVQSFAGAFSGAALVAGSAMGDSIEFKYLYKQYVLELVAKGLAAHDDNLLVGTNQTLHTMNDSRYPPTLYPQELTTAQNTMVPLPDLAAWLAKKAAAAADPGNSTLQAELAAMRQSYETNLGDFVAIGGTYFGILKGVAFQFALANFLIQENLTGVVDLGSSGDTTPSLGGDAHGNNLISILVAVFTFAAFRLMLSNLRNHLLPDGRTLLQATTVLMHTELDREPFLTPAQANGGDSFPGTNHGYTTSAFLAGGGVRGGRVIGEMHHGPAHLAAYGEGYCTSLPIDPNTGRPKPVAEGGRVITVKAIFPTILTLFGMRVPEQQITEFGPLPAVWRT
jgi:hypothetical protein